MLALWYILLLLAIGQVQEVSLICKPDGVINICTIVWMVSNYIVHKCYDIFMY